MNQTNKSVGTLNPCKSPVVWGKGIIIAMGITLISLLVFAIVLTYSSLAENCMAPVIIAITAISIWIGASISTIPLQKNGIFNGGMIGFWYIAILYGISSICTTGFSLNGQSAILIISSILAGMVGGIVGVNVKKP